MIARLTGILEEIGDDRVLVQCDGLGYEVLIPPASRPMLLARRGETITLYTFHYLEGGMGTSNPIPRLAGFLTQVEREFAERFITVKGMGIRAVLKALTAPVQHIAQAIEQKDIRALTQLPGIGKRSAEQIIAELNGKVAKYALLRTEEGAVPAKPVRGGLLDDLVDVLLQLGYSSTEAETMAARVLQQQTFESIEDAIQELFRQQAGATV